MPVPTIDELTDFIDDPLCAKLEANRKIRRKNRRRNAFIMAVVLLLFLPAAIAATIWHGRYGNEFLGGASSISIPIILALVFAFLYMPLRLRFSSEEIPFEYVPDVVTPAIQFIDPRLAYGEEKGLACDDIVEGGLLSTTPDRFESNHRFEGMLRDAEVHFAYVEAQVTTKKVFRAVTDDAFCGLFLTSRYDKFFDGTTIVTPRGGDTECDEEFESIDVDIGNIDRDFACRSTTPETTRQWFTPSLVERISALDDAFAAGNGATPPWRIVFRGPRLYFAYKKPDYFDRQAPRYSVDTTHLHRVGRQLRALIDLVEFIEVASGVFDEPSGDYGGG